MFNFCRHVHLNLDGRYRLNFCTLVVEILDPPLMGGEEWLMYNKKAVAQDLLNRIP
jgi:hypothetical protein